MFTLYEFSSSGNCYKLRLAMAQLGISFRRIEKDITRGETRATDFLAINPNGRIPVLVTPDNKVLPESNAALWYLGKDSKLMPEDDFQQAQALQWMFFEQYNHEPNIATGFMCWEKGKSTPRPWRKSSKRGTTPCESWKAICQVGTSLSVVIIPLPTLPCMPIPMWPGRVVFRWRIIRRFGPGWNGLNNSRATCLWRLDNS